MSAHLAKVATLCAFAPSLFGTAASSKVSVIDAPYIETVPFQFTYSDYYPKAPQWGEIPEKCCIGQVVAAPDQKTVLKFDSGSVYVASRNAKTYKDQARQSNAAAYQIDAVDASAIAGLKDPSSQFLTTPDGGLVAVVSSTGVVPVQCNLASGNASPACSAGDEAAFDFGTIVDVAFSGGSDNAWEFLVVSSSGLHKVSTAAFPAKCTVQTFDQVPQTGLTAVGVAPFTGKASSRASGTSTAFVAGAQHLYLINSDTGDVTHKEWISNVTSGAGGAVDGPVSTMAFDAHDQRLVLGTEGALNVFAPTLRITRVAHREGLPYGNVTAIASRVTQQSVMGALKTPESQVWIGTKMGVAVWQESNDPDWRYLFGPRWHPGTAVKALAIHEAATTQIGNAMESVPATIVVATDGGVSFLEQQEWTLAVRCLFVCFLSMARALQSLALFSLPT